MRVRGLPLIFFLKIPVYAFKSVIFHGRSGNDADADSARAMAKSLKT